MTPPLLGWPSRAPGRGGFVVVSEPGCDANMLACMPRTPDNDGSSSICTRHEYGPIRYHWYPRTDGERFGGVVREVVSTIVMPRADRERLIGEMRGRMEKLREGRLKPISHVVGPMDTVTGVQVFEVKAQVDYGPDSRALLRAYHAEPRKLRSAREGSTIVGLHVHRKVTDGSKAEVRAAQDEELQTARSRYFLGQPSNWGVVKRP